MKMRRAFVIAALLAPTFPVGCGGDGGEPPADPFACIADWPTEANASLAAPLAVTPALVWTQPLDQYGSLPTIQSHVMTVAGSNVVVAFLNGTAAFDRATGQFRWMAQPVTQDATVSFLQPAPLADPDGNVYGVAADTYSLDAMGASRWQVRTAAYVDYSHGGEFYDVFRSPPALSPDGLLFVHDGQSVGALRTPDGSEVWRVKSAAPLMGAGSVLVFDSDVRRAADGQLLGQVRATDGSRLHVRSVAGFGFMGWRGNGEGLEAVDPCDQVLWSLPSGSSTTLLGQGVGPTGIAYAARTARNSGSPYTLMTISPAGEILAAITTSGFLMALGADGTAYLQDCSADPVQIIALDEGLRELWRLPVEGMCAEDAVLGEGGLLYLVNYLYPNQRLVAVQTTSPGLAPTGWPMFWHDARSTRWLGP
jgi:outer membrane protein assembly factor BamB